jgi:hypothetical protein
MKPWRAALTKASPGGRGGSAAAAVSIRAL